MGVAVTVMVDQAVIVPVHVVVAKLSLCRSMSLRRRPRWKR